MGFRRIRKGELTCGSLRKTFLNPPTGFSSALANYAILSLRPPCLPLPERTLREVRNRDNSIRVRKELSPRELILDVSEPREKRGKGHGD